LHQTIQQKEEDLVELERNGKKVLEKTINDKNNAIAELNRISKEKIESLYQTIQQKEENLIELEHKNKKVLDEMAESISVLEKTIIEKDEAILVQLSEHEEIEKQLEKKITHINQELANKKDELIKQKEIYADLVREAQQKELSLKERIEDMNNNIAEMQKAYQTLEQKAEDTEKETKILKKIIEDKDKMMTKFKSEHEVMMKEIQEELRAEKEELEKSRIMHTETIEKARKREFSLERMIEVKNDNMAELQKTIESKEEMMTKFKSEHEVMMKEIQEELRAEKEKLEKSRIMYTETIEKAKEREFSLERMIEVKNDNMAELQKTIESKEEMMTAFKSEHEVMMKEIQEELSAEKEELEKSKILYAETIKRELSLNQMLEVKNADIAELQKTIERKEEMVTAFKSEHEVMVNEIQEELRAEKEKLEKSRIMHTETIEKAKERELSLNQMIEVKNADIAELQKTIERKEEMVTAFKSEHEVMMKEIQEELRAEKEKLSKSKIMHTETIKRELSLKQMIEVKNDDIAELQKTVESKEEMMTAFKSEHEVMVNEIQEELSAEKEELEKSKILYAETIKRELSLNQMLEVKNADIAELQKTIKSKEEMMTVAKSEYEVMMKEIQEELRAEKEKLEKSKIMHTETIEKAIKRELSLKQMSQIKNDDIVELQKMIDGKEEMVKSFKSEYQVMMKEIQEELKAEKEKLKKSKIMHTETIKRELSLKQMLEVKNDDIAELQKTIKSKEEMITAFKSEHEVMIKEIQKELRAEKEELAKSKIIHTETIKDLKKQYDKNTLKNEKTILLLGKNIEFRNKAIVQLKDMVKKRNDYIKKVNKMYKNSVKKVKETESV